MAAESSMVSVPRPFAFHPGPVNAVAFGTVDGRPVLASGGDDGTVRLWDPATREPVGEPLTGHTGPVRAVAFGTADGHPVLASGGDDGTVRLWDPATGQELENTASRSVPRLGADSARPPIPSPGRPGPTPSPQVLVTNPISDSPAEKDLLGFADEVEELAMLACARETDPPLAIALLADWGSGKSSFMAQMKNRVEAYTGEAREDPAGSYFLANVCQVRFNAWHYNDDTVWVGIIDQLFHELRASLGQDPPEPADRREQREQFKEELNGIAERIQEAEAELEELRSGDTTHQPPECGPAQQHPARRDHPIIREMIREVKAQRLTLSIWLGTALLLLVVAGALWWWTGSKIASTALGVFTVASIVGKVVLQIARAENAILRHLVEERAKYEEELKTKEEELKESRIAIRRDLAKLQAQKEELITELAGLDPLAGLADFVRQGPGDDLAMYCGIVTKVHAQLEQLDKYMQDAASEWLRPPSPGQAVGGARLPIERIILYIDDLDRCPPHKVVETLTAAHLLLALPMFIVVVGVDAHWLSRSLEHHDRTMFTTGHSPEALPAEVVGDPMDYLDKIFQIPFRLQPPSPAAASAFVRRLLPPPHSPPPTGPPASSAPPVSAEPEIAKTTIEPPETRATPAATPKPSGVSEPAKSTGDQTTEPDPSTPSQDKLVDVPARHRRRAIDTRPQSLLLTKHEVDYLADVSALLATPRAMKKLVNLYRLVRVGVRDTNLAEFAGTPDAEPYRAVALLLGVLVGFPKLASVLFPAIDKAKPDEKIRELVADTGWEEDAHHSGHAPKRGAHAASFCPLCASLARLREGIVTVSNAAPGIPETLRPYQAQIKNVSRFSFHTIPLGQRASASSSP